MTQALDNNAGKNRVRIFTLKKRRDFLRIAAGRVKWVSKSMIVQMAPMPGSDGPSSSRIRIGYTASKKVGNAVKRNRAKRRLRDVVRALLPSGGRAGHDYVLIARTATVEVPHDQLIRDFSWCLRRLKTQTPAGRPSDAKGMDHRLSAPNEGFGRVKKRLS